MSRTYAAPLDPEHYGLTFEHPFLTALRGRELHPEIEELWSVGTIYPGEDNSGYLLAVVSHLTAPLDEVDVANADRRETLICGCKGYYMDCYDNQVGAKIDDCKHCQRIKQKRRTDIPEEQATL